MVNKTAVPSPVRTARKSLHLTQAALAQRVGLDRQAVMRNEQAIFPMPSPTLLEFFQSELVNFNESQFIDSYRAFQLAQRRASFGILSEIFPLTAYLMYLKNVKDLESLPVGGLDSPLTFWINDTYPSGFPVYALSKYLCIQQSVLYNFDNGNYRLNSVPGQFREAMLEAGYSESCLDNLQHGFTRYKSVLKDRSLKGLVSNATNAV